MGKTLIITEKPSVAGEYAAILGVPKKGKGAYQGGDYIITWCVGHLIEMSYPEKYDAKYAKWRLEDLPFLPETYQYDVISSVKEQYEVVHRLMNSPEVTEILYASDSGREGEVIIRLIRNYGGVKTGITERRVWIDSFTEDEIARGIREAKPLSSYDNLANAGIMRGIEDYAMGINFSRALSVKYGSLVNVEAATKKYAGIAIGRVMTCVLGMVVRREREIRDFVQTFFYRIIGNFGQEGLASTFDGEWKVGERSKFFNSPLLYSEKGFKKEEDARFLIDSLDRESAVVAKKEKTTEKKRAPLLFNLAELQAECTKKFRISPEDTLKVVQNLYEKKLTTYPRTDARVLTTAIADEITKNLSGLYRYEPVQDFVLKIRDEGLYKNLKKTVYVDDKKVTDHYAIIPTGNVSEYNKLNELERKIYDLIVRRFLAIFYPPALYDKVGILINMGHKHSDYIETFQASVRVLKDRGYLEVMGVKEEKKSEQESEDEKSEEVETTNEGLLELLSKLKKGSKLIVSNLYTKEGKTTPPKRYTSGSMILAMENAGQLIEDEELRETIKGAGIGTSATRAGIIEKLIVKGYIALNKKTQILTPQLLGEMIYEVVLATIPSMLNPEMTASWEKGLSKVEAGEITPEKYEETLNTYVRKYTDNIKTSNLSPFIRKKLREVKTITEK